MDSKQLADLIAALEAERLETVNAANQRIAYLNGKIEMLQELAANTNEIAPVHSNGVAEVEHEG